MHGDTQFDQLDNAYCTGSDELILTHDRTDYILGGAGNDIALAGEGNDWIDGQAGNDTLYGNEGDDTLIGGAGADAMAGGLGDDAYVLNNASDTVVELADEGTDSVESSVTTILGATEHLAVDRKKRPKTKSRIRPWRTVKRQR